MDQMNPKLGPYTLCHPFKVHLVLKVLDGFRVSGLGLSLLDGDAEPTYCTHLAEYRHAKKLLDERGQQCWMAARVL